MKKKTVFLSVISLLMAGSIALAEESGGSTAADSVWVYDDLNCSIYVEGTLSGDVTIPAKINGNQSYALQISALSGQNEITSLTLPEGMYTLQDNSVVQMEKVQSITLNDDLEVIGTGNIANCPALTSVTIPASVRMIGSAFMQCESLQEIRFLGECPVFLDTAFCFFWMPDDYVIYVPDDQYDAYAEAFQDANGAAEHLQPSGQNAVPREEVNNEDWFEFDASTGAITGYREYHSYVEIPETIDGTAVKSIAENAMYKDPTLFALVIPEGVECVENSACQFVYDLTYIKFPSTLKVIGDDAFGNTQGMRIDWSEGLEEIGARAFQDIIQTSLTLPSTVKTIGESAFESTWLQELYLGGDLESIGSRAFADSRITYMAFDFYEPIEIAEDAFVGNPAEDLDLPWDSSFENQAQYAEILRDQCPDCTVWINNPESGGVAEYPVPDPEVSVIENDVWLSYTGDRPNLTPWPIYNDVHVTALGKGIFKGNQTIRSFYPHHCFWFTTIGDEAFADSSLEYFEAFGSIETIGSGAFRNCLNLTELTLPASLTSIGEGALDGCTNLQKITVLCDPAILPEGLFEDCTALTEIYLAEDASNEQVACLSDLVGYPWYSPVCRVGETRRELMEMPDEALSIDDFWYDTEYLRLDRYHGFELNLYLPHEAEGMTLNMIGGDMMGRARDGDNFEMELPVRSVVIPENYTDIPSWTFADCKTLETVICYAPLEQLSDRLFENCTNLREVVFVNGVRSVGSYVFAGCENLETVYLGEFVETVAENAFLNEDGSDAFDSEKCITDPALLPDVEALLAAVKSDPMPEPETEPEPEAAPVGEEGAAYIGKWQADVMEMEGETYSVAELGAEMSFTLYADGTAESFDGETTENGVWMIEDGTVVLEGMPLLFSDGKLVMEEDGMKLYFVKTDASDNTSDPADAADPGIMESEVPASGAMEPEAAESEVPEPAADIPVSSGQNLQMECKYTCQSAEVDGVTLNASMLGGEYALTFHADGTVDFVMVGTPISGLKWTQSDTSFVIDYYGNSMEVTLTENGLDMNYFDAMLMHYVPENGTQPSVYTVPMQMTYEEVTSFGYEVLNEQTNGFTVYASRDYTNGETLKIGVFRDGEPIWGYCVTCPYDTELQITNAFMAGTAQDPTVIIFNAEESMRMVDLVSGEVIWEKSIEELQVGGSLAYDVGEDGTIYCAGYYDRGPTAISMSGEVLWRAQPQDPETYWPYAIEVEDPYVLVVYATGTETENDVVAYGMDGSWQWADKKSAY